ncbi:hypothetical protein EDD98_5932 [Streptomyces sp. PanSC19]|nr:hypothetical protein EDD98_5932 [Streptomyces sp. PanSC19]
MARTVTGFGNRGSSPAPPTLRRVRRPPGRRGCLRTFWPAPSLMTWAIRASVPYAAPTATMCVGVRSEGGRKVRPPLLPERVALVDARRGVGVRRPVSSWGGPRGAGPARVSGSTVREKAGWAPYRSTVSLRQRPPVGPDLLVTLISRGRLPVPAAALAECGAVPFDGLLLYRGRRMQQGLGNGQILGDADHRPLRAGPFLDRSRGARVDVGPAVRALSERHGAPLALRGGSTLGASTRPLFQRFVVLHPGIVAERQPGSPPAHSCG